MDAFTASLYIQNCAEQSRRQFTEQKSVMETDTAEMKELKATIAGTFNELAAWNDGRAFTAKERKRISRERNDAFRRSLSKGERVELERLIASDDAPESFWTRNYGTTLKKLTAYFKARSKGQAPQWRAVKAAKQ